ncbi:MAG: alkaline phosphatase family protein [Lautropia sp.]
MTQPPVPHEIDAGSSILNLAATLALRFGAAAGAPLLAGHAPLQSVLAATRSVVLVVFDGLGERQLSEHAGRGALADCRLGSLSSVFPSATAPAMTSLATALPPAQHGTPGWLMWSEADGEIVRCLPMDVRGQPDRPVSAASLWRWQPWSAALRLPVVSLLPRAISESTYSRYAYSAGRRIGYEHTDDVPQRIAELLGATIDGAYIFVYLPHFDAASHEFGWRSERAERTVLRFDRWFARLIDALRDCDALVLATADHGFIDVPERQQLRLEALPEIAACLARPLAGEPRVPFCQVLPRSHDVFAERVREATHGEFEAYRSEALLTAGWFGRPDQAVASSIAGRLGTHVLLPRGGATLIDQVEGERPLSFIGMHGGPSADEMQVPLIAAYLGRALA